MLARLYGRTMAVMPETSTSTNAFSRSIRYSMPQGGGQLPMA
jgi:hypothetical protein